MEEILERENPREVRSLFGFDSSDSDEEVLFKFRLWCRWAHAKFFFDDARKHVIGDAPFHDLIDRNNLRVYRGVGEYFVDAAYRGAAKTTRTKLFIGFVIANDLEHLRRYFKILTEDGGNSQQSVTDIYNLFVVPRMLRFYPEIFQKTIEKRTETMKEFDTATRIKVRAGTVGQSQRGQLQDEARPDFVWFDDFETRKTLRSLVMTNSIWNNMEEARTGLSRTGGAVYTCNYLSERGNVHKLIEKYLKQTLIVPICGTVEVTVSGGIVDVAHTMGPPTWTAAYTMARVEKILKEADDPAGEYLQAPAEGNTVFFNRKRLDKMEKCKPIDESAGFKLFDEYDPSHRYALANDVAGGLGLDSSTSVVIDFSQFPCKVVGTYKSNLIKPDTFGDEIKRQGRMFGYPLVAPENNNYGHATIGRLKQIYPNERIYTMKEKETRAGTPQKVRQWGWNTNAATKTEMFSALQKAVKDGLIDLSDPDLIAEARVYTSDDLLDEEQDPRLATRHFDLLIACAIAWQMKNIADTSEKAVYQQAEYEPVSEYEGLGRPEATPMMNIRYEDQSPASTGIPKSPYDEPPQAFEQPAYESSSEYEGGR